MIGFGRHYLTIKDIEDVDSARAVRDTIYSRLNQMNINNLVEGCSILILDDKEKINFELLEPEEILLFSDGQLPAVFVNIAYKFDQDNQEEITQLEKDFDLRLFKTFSIQYS